MSDKYTRKDAELAFGRLCEVLGKRPATAYNDVGAWTLDYNPIYGGAVVEEVINDGGGITQPLGSTRCTPREFCLRVNFLIRALETQ